MSRRRRPPSRGRGQPLDSWPLDPSAAQQPPRPASNGDQPTPTTHPAPAPGAARPGLRRFFCRTCRGGEVGTDPPNHWYRLQIREEALARRNSQTYATVGLFCSVPCLTVWAATASEKEAAE